MKYFIYFVCFLIINLWCNCNIYQSLRYGGIPKQSTYRHFNHNIIQAPSNSFTFPIDTFNTSWRKSIGLSDKQFISTNVSLDKFVLLHKTISFLIIRSDTIVYEWYKDGVTPESLVSSFSLAKPIVSTLIGIAIDDRLINSLDDPIVVYLNNFKDKPGWNEITVKNLLHHTSGIKFTDNKFDPASDNAEFYWGNNLRKEILEASIQVKPDSVFHYSSINTMLLALILEKVTGGSVSKYLEDKIWIPCGMEAPAYWSLDRSDNMAIEKAFCCLQARTIDFAKIARLYLNNGNWQGKQIVSKDWVNYSTHSDPSGNNKHFFNNNWGIGPYKYNSYFAAGLYGQYLYVYPEKSIIIVRFGEKDLSYNPNYWQNIFLQLLDQL